MTWFGRRWLGRGSPGAPQIEELPLRSELFSADQMERHGKRLAAAHRLTPLRSRDRLLPRLAANEAVLIDVYRRLTAAAVAKQRISPAGEWLLDNFHLLEEQIATAKRHLPRGYSRELPRLSLGASAGLPRVYDIALETIAHGDGRVDGESLSRFMTAYQSVTTLKLGELWAIPIMLRLALIENLRRGGVRIAAGRAERDLANTWADRMMDTAERDPKSLILVIADMARSSPPMGTAFVAELARRLQGQSAALALALTWIEQRLGESHQTIEQLVQLENQQQASDQVSISNSIGSLRFLSQIDWRDFVESISHVEQLLRQDPRGVYALMDFATRDRYRHATERIAKRGLLTEPEVAAKAIELARAGASRRGVDDRSAHVGFYLIDTGVPELERAATMGRSAIDSARHLAGRFPLAIYLGAIASLSGLFTAGIVANAYAAGANRETVALVVVLALLISSQLALTLVNWIATLIVAPQGLPRMDFSRGIAPGARTLVVVPTLLGDAANVEELVESMEVRFLANRDAHLHFALLTDFPDARTATLLGDEALLGLLESRVAELNLKYGRAEQRPQADLPPEVGAADNAETSASVFFLFHRPRTWNAAARMWMGEERKRGKLGDLNSFLRGGHPDGFSLVVGATTVLSSVKYVITLDTDTQLPRDAARELVGAMAHPLNAPHFGPSANDHSSEVVTTGYGILQPRVAVSLVGAHRSRYAALHAGDPGVDPYTRTVSDVYQDVFHEGSFIGKGIYDVDAFERALKGRFPSNRILSHDLLEGCYVRSGLLSDTQLYEAFPARYSGDMARRRRWIRGDWQLVGWLRRTVPGRDGRRERNPLSMLSQWKLFDNLRRSLVPAAMTSLLLLGWTVFWPPWFWTAIVVAVLLVPAAITSLAELVSVAPEVSFRRHASFVLDGAQRHFTQAILALAFLPYEAFISLDAIARTVGRMLVTRRRLLEWNPSSDEDLALARPERADLLASYRAMAIAPAIAAGSWIALSIVNPMALIAAWPVLMLWAAAPALAWWISRPLARKETTLSMEQLYFLRNLARRTWAYFDTYVGAENHWLPPDNVQEDPSIIVAHRTSPTNMGLSLLANLTAHDFGFISGGQLVARTASALSAMQSLERHRGHFYNWYDTKTRQPLPPLYISTVDSGNLAGHLVTLRPGLLAVLDAPVLNPRWLDGIADTARVFIDADDGEAAGAIAELKTRLQWAHTRKPLSLEDAWVHVVRLSECADHIASSFPLNPAATAVPDVTTWAHALARQCADFRDDLLALAPWIAAASSSRLHANAPAMSAIPTLRDLAALLPHCELAGEVAEPADMPENVGERAPQASMAVLRARGARAAQARIRSIEALAAQAAELADIDYTFLFDDVRRQLTIGYNVSDHRRDASYYDLLASEARLGLFVAIAQGKLAQESWFALGRTLTSAGGEPVLLSWSGSMFEYLMPLLVMPTYENTLLDQTYIAAVQRQIQYGNQRDVAWGISESGYNTVDIHFNYQYRAFGVPGLGLKRGLADELVVAPYASALALMIAPTAACRNLQRLAVEGSAGRFGLFEAVDHTPSRQRRGETKAIVRSFMVHHQGMSLLALAYLLLGKPMQKRFASDPALQAHLLLLQERIPRATRLHVNGAGLSEPPIDRSGPALPVRVVTSPDTVIPEVQLLSNGRYHVMVTNAGSGSSRWRDVAITRWREDATCDNWGTFCYIRDRQTGAFWSAAHQPTLVKADRYEAIFSEGRAEFRRTDSDFDTHTEIVVSPEDDIEVRRIHVTNRSRVARSIDVTSYCEVVLAPAAGDALHPAFSNLFVQTEIVEAQNAIVCSRRPRSHDEQVPWMCHLMAVQGAHVDAMSCETDRMRFIGRNRSVASPKAMVEAGALSGTSGSVLDPVASIRAEITLDAGATAIVDMVTGACATREGALQLVHKYQDKRLTDRAFELTWSHSHVVLRQLNVSEADSQLYSRLAGSVIYANAALRAPPAVLVRNRRGQSGLWGYAISGDMPIVLLQIADCDNIELVRQLVRAHAYWRLKGLAVDLVIWNEDRDGYRQRLQEQIMGLIAAGVEAHGVDRPGGIFIRHAEQISAEDRTLFQAVARVILTDAKGTLADQVGRRGVADVRVPRLVPTRTHRTLAPAATVVPADLMLFNGTGGFSSDGREYVIAPATGNATPAPWANVIANANFGSVVSASGLGYTWSENAHLFRLTAWHNDPVTESTGEAIYLRDEESGYFWSPTDLPCGRSAACVTRHGFGYSVFDQEQNGIQSSLTVFVAIDASVKFFVLKMTNRSGRLRRLSATGYVEWVLGDLRAKSGMHVTTAIDASSGALTARNPYHAEFGDWIAFLHVDDPGRSLTGDRNEFIGRNGTLRDPAALHRTRLSGKVGAALDPCAALQVAFELADGQEHEIVFRLGAASSSDAMAALLQRTRGSVAAHEALDAVMQHWRRTLSAVQVDTPDLALNVLANGWLVYQTMACRLWARSGFYQSGGAFGFRDQLQDVMALVHADPSLARAQIVLSASRQFVDGDVQHWWHPPLGRGVRTRCSDDYLWLPLALCRYVATTGDRAILDEPVSFLEGRPVGADDDSYYDLPVRSDETASVYEHCKRAIVHGLRFGAHGLPLMGSGDWNDGMNLVGIHGKGESVWLAFFLCHVLAQFARVARQHEDASFAERCAAEAQQLQANVEASGWDGAWYRRAYFDDGSPLGSASSPECQIDSIAQSWSVLSGAGDRERSGQAMNAAYARLVRTEQGLIQLLDPPFDKSSLDPGYIRGYVPGVRENGGQYTHAAIWTAMAFAAMGDSARAWALTAMINPLNHARTPDAVATYKVEPYVVAADVYAVPPHSGRGGWTWYTGSAGWMYRLVVESLLGLELEGNRLRILPCVPDAWRGYKIRYRYGETYYDIAVMRAPDRTAAADGTSRLTLDGTAVEGDSVMLADDRGAHRIEVCFTGPASMA